MGPDDTPRVVTLRGLVVPTEWDSGGEVLRVAILTPDEMQYDVSEAADGSRQLLPALREEVEVRVRIDRARGCRRDVTLLSFTVLDPPDDDGLGGLLNEPDRADW